MSRSARAASGFITSLVQYTAQILVQILLAPVVLRLAGREALGAYAAIMQTLGFLALVDIAHSWSLERFLGQSLGIDDGGSRFRQVFTTARTLLLLTNCIFAGLVVIFSLFIAQLFDLSPEIASEARRALYVIAFWSVVRTPLAAYLNALVATQDLATTNVIGAILGIARTVASLLFVLGGSGLFGLMLSGTIVEACGSFLYRVRFKRKHPHLMPAWGIPDTRLLYEMIGFGGHAIFLNIGNMLVFSSGNTLAGLTNGAAAASSFYTTQMPTMTAYNMVLRLSDSATPAINEIHGRGEFERMRHVLVRLTRTLLMMAIPLSVGVLLFNRDLVTTWVGEEQYAGSLLTSCLALFCLIIAIQRVAIVYSFVCGWMRVLTATAFLQGLAQFLLAYFLGVHLGLGGIALSLVVVTLPQTAILWRKLAIHFQLNVVDILVRCLLRALIPVICASVLALLVHTSVIIGRKNYGPLLAETATFALTYCSLAYLTMHKDDKAELQRHAVDFLARGRRLTRRIANLMRPQLR